MNRINVQPESRLLASAVLLPAFVFFLAAGLVTSQTAPSDTKPRTNPGKTPASEADANKAATKNTAPADPDTKAGSAPSLLPARQENFDLTPEQTERFKKYLPKTHAKLTARDPLQIVAVGDSIVDMYLYDEAAGDWLQGYPAVFAKELAGQFYYTGGVRVIRPNPGKAAKDHPFRGPEILLRNLGRGGKTMIHAMQTITTHGFENPPDLVLVSFGINDSTMNLSLASYARAIQEVIETVRSKGAEIILLGPTSTVNDPPEESLGLTRPFADTMRDLAADAGVFYTDLGDLTGLLSIPPEKKEPEQIFDEAVKQYRRFFNHGGQTDYTHPRPELHALLGKRIYSELVHGTKPAPWSLSQAGAFLKSDTQFELSYQLKNETGEAARFCLLPLLTPVWKPQDAVPDAELKAGESKSLKVLYTRRDTAGKLSPLPAHEPLLRLPVFFSGAGESRVDVLRANISPVALLSKSDALYNQEGEFSLDYLLVNHSGAEAKGLWSAEWMGQTRTGDFKLEPEGKHPFSIRLALPTGADAPFRQRQPLTIKLTCNGQELRQTRDIEISRNIGLKQAIPLTVASSDVKPPDAAATAGVRLKFDADAKNLFVTYEIAGLTLEDSGTPQGALGLELNLDARSFGKRLGFGATDAIRLNAKAADGPAQVANLPPWCFGTGYGALFDPAHMRATLSSGAQGIRRLSLTIPRSYLYLHEWALGNGNSQIGVGTSIMFWRGPREGAPQGDFPQDAFFSLLKNQRHRDDAEGLAVLELTEKPTARWTVLPQ